MLVMMTRTIMNAHYFFRGFTAAQPHRGNGTYLAFSLRKRDWVRRTERFGRSLYLWRGLLRRSYFFLIRLTARGSRRPGRSGNLSAAKASSNLSHNARRFFLERAWLMA